MSERRASYLLATKSAPVDISCLRCGAILGAEVRLANGVYLMRIGDVLIRSINGFCEVCGTEWHWSDNDKRLAQLLNRLPAQPLDE